MGKLTGAILGACLAAGMVGCSSDDSSSPPTNNMAGSSGSGGTNTTTTTGGGTAGSGGGMSVADSAAPEPESGAGGASSTPPVDAAVLGDVAAQGDGGNARSKKDYQCNLLMGVSVTYDWFTSGFENGVDGSRWEAMAPSQALVSFIQMWNDPNNQLWSMAKISPCTQHPDAPDRVIFTGVNWDYTTADEWVPQLDKMVKTLQMKFPGVKEIDLMTMLRAPNNMSCGSTESVVQPFIDQAIATVAPKYPGLVEISPKFFAPSCTVFTGGGPHFTDMGKMTIAKLYSDYYSKEP
jgi:hypothetical protein